MFKSKLSKRILASHRWLLSFTVLNNKSAPWFQHALKFLGDFICPNLFCFFFTVSVRTVMGVTNSWTRVCAEVQPQTRMICLDVIGKIGLRLLVIYANLNLCVVRGKKKEESVTRESIECSQVTRPVTSYSTSYDSTSYVTFVHRSSSKKKKWTESGNNSIARSCSFR